MEGIIRILKIVVVIIFLFIVFVFQLESEVVSFSSSDTLIVQTFTFDDIENRRGVFNFPTRNDTYQKIILQRTLKCDKKTTRDKYPCGEWDYSTNTVVYVNKADSVEEKFELEGFVTPYGKGLDLNGDCGFSWFYDVTDYATLLKGKVDISSGNKQELLDMKFFFIKGTPARNVLEIKNIYPLGHYIYKDLADDDTLKTINLLLREDAAGFKLRARISGHGHKGPRNCCEWDSKTHTYYDHGQVLYRWNVWKDCGYNPVYPQGGTWQFDRAGWCPGTPVDTYDFELTNKVMPGDTLEFDYGIEYYSDNGEKDGQFRMSHQLFSYGKPNFKNDAAIMDIISPSSKDTYSRINTSSKHPIIKIQNSGSNTLYSLDIEYGVLGKNEIKKFYKWVGRLEFLETETFHLADLTWSDFSIDSKFYVKIVKTNGNTDDYIKNNLMVSTVDLPITLPNKFIIHIESNDKDRAMENSYTITDENGKIFYERYIFADDTVYNDVISLEKGSYEFRLTDKYQDGMIKHWWNRNSNKERVGKNGKISIMDIDEEKDKVIKKLKFDFADEVSLQFLVE